MNTVKDLKGRTALITGSAIRIGRAITLALAREGVNILVHYNKSAKHARELIEKLELIGVKAESVQADFSDPADAGNLFHKAAELNANPDILINNASIFPDDNFCDFQPDDFQNCVNINALTPALISRAFAGQTETGDIINILDCRMKDYDASHLSYHLSKRLLFSLTRIMAVEFAPGIRVNGIAPGLILPVGDQDESSLQELKDANLLKCRGIPEDITRTVLFLLNSSFITGQVIYVDGGRFLKGCFYGT